MSHDHPLELSADAFRALVEDALARVLDHIASLPGQPAADVAGAAELSRALIEREPPEVGRDSAELLDLVFRAVPKSFNTAGPGYLAYIPGGGLLQSAVADFVADAVNRYVGVFAAAPLLVQLEQNVVRWFCRIVGYGDGAGGFLTTGGSLANFSAILTARRDRLPENFLSGTLYASDQVHHSVQKAALLAGFPPSSVREIASDGEYRIRLDELSRAIAEDRRAGKTPFLVAGNAGSTNTGAVDDLEALADLCAKERLWLHVDAAYGGFFLLTERGRRTMQGIERADSVVLDPHKGLFLPYGNGSLVVKDAGTLRRAHAVGAHYLPGMQDDPDLVDFCEISPELSRDFRGLRVWLPIQMHGLGAFRSALDEKLDLAQLAADRLRVMPNVEIVAEPQLSLLAFRHVPPDLAGGALDAWNRTLLARVNERQRVHVTGTILPCGYVLRICVLSFRTHADRIGAALEDFQAAIAQGPE